MAIVDDIEVGKLLEKIRESLNPKSVRSFAIKAKIDPSHYSKLESGDASLSPVNLQKLISTYGEEPYKVFRGMRYGIDIPYYTPSLEMSELVDGQHRIFISESELKEDEIINNIEDPLVRRLINKMSNAEAKLILDYFNKYVAVAINTKKSVETDYKDKYFKLLEKREEEISLTDLSLDVQSQLVLSREIFQQLQEHRSAVEKSEGNTDRLSSE